MILFTLPKFIFSIYTFFLYLSSTFWLIDLSNNFSNKCFWTCLVFCGVKYLRIGKLYVRFRVNMSCYFDPLWFNLKVNCTWRAATFV